MCHLVRVRTVVCSFIRQWDARQTAYRPRRVQVWSLLVAGALLLATVPTGAHAAWGTPQQPTKVYYTDPDMQHPAMPQPVLLGATAAWYAPSGDRAAPIPAGTPYTPQARYGSAWVLATFEDYGDLWVAAHHLPPLPLTSLPDQQPAITGFMGYRPTAGEDALTIAQRTGSDTGVLLAYNNLAPDSTIRSAFPLVVPMLADRTPAVPAEPLVIRWGDTTQPRVALTIDVEVGNADMHRLLAVMREHDVTATFFLLGTWAEWNPDVVQQMILDGHEIGNHSYSHANFTTLTPEEIKDELNRTEEILQRHGATTRPYFRLPFGEYNETVLRASLAAGYLPLHWSLDSLDWQGPPKTGEEAVDAIIGGRTPEQMYGGTILAHCCIRTTTIDAIPIMKQRFDEMGIEISTVGQTLAADDYR